MLIQNLRNIPMPEDYELVFFGDNQEGNRASSAEKLKECIGYILSAKNNNDLIKYLYLIKPANDYSMELH